MRNIGGSVVSAQVILRPASGRIIDGRAIISAENIARFAPSPAAVASATAEFRSKGFEIGPVVGISFSVSGTIEVFENFFGMRIHLGKDGAFEFAAKNGVVGHELKGTGLPESIRESVQAVAFPLPPDFGPTKFHV